MRYLTLAEAFTIAEAVTGVPTETLAKSPRLGLLDSALHAPQAGFGGEEFYPDFVDKAAVLAVRIARALVRSISTGVMSPRRSAIGALSGTPLAKQLGSP